MLQKKSSEVLIEAKTSPQNTPDEWAKIKWSGGKTVSGNANRRSVNRDVSVRETIKAEYGGTTYALDVWVIWASVDIMIKGTRPKGASHHNSWKKGGTEECGAVTFTTNADVEFPEDKDNTASRVSIMQAAGKVVAVATLQPKGVSAIVKFGWTLRRKVQSRAWFDGAELKEGKDGTPNFVDDTSDVELLRLLPDSDAKIYDIDAPGMSYGGKYSEMYDNFKKWVEWNGERCSEDALWSWSARWKKDRNPAKQVKLNALTTTNIVLPAKAHYLKG